MVVDYSHRVWSFSTDRSREYQFVGRDTAAHADILLRISDLERSKTERLTAFLNRELPILRAAPGRTELIVHNIDVGDSVPIKQRYYPVTPIGFALIFAR